MGKVMSIFGSCDQRQNTFKHIGRLTGKEAPDGWTPKGLAETGLED
jgi:hypothetical protein